MEYRQGDVRDPAALQEAFAGADVVVHLAFLITGNASRETTRAINVDGTLNAFRAAAAAGARRFVYASSVAAYGFHPDNPERIDEDWPMRPAARLFYAQEKAELEDAARGRGGRHPELALYLLRPPVVLGPHAVGGKDVLPGPARPLGRRLFSRPRGSRCPLPLLVPALPLQLIHEDDVGQRAAAVRRRRRAARRLQHRRRRRPDRRPTSPASSAPCPCPCRPGRRRRPPGRSPGCRSCPRSPSGSRRPATRRSWTPRGPSEELGWRPRYTALEALRDTLRDRRVRLRPVRSRQPAEHLAGHPLGHLQLRHVPDAGAAPRTASPGAARRRRGRRRPGPAGPDRPAPSAPAPHRRHRRAVAAGVGQQPAAATGPRPGRPGPCRSTSSTLLDQRRPTGR